VLTLNPPTTGSSAIVKSAVAASSLNLNIRMPCAALLPAVMPSVRALAEAEITRHVTSGSAVSQVV
jgi:hypothetical protein